MICEKCGKEHNGSYGSGRFCSKSCANSRSFSEQTKAKIKDSINNSDKFKEAMKKLRNSGKLKDTSHLIPWRKKQMEQRLNRKVKISEKCPEGSRIVVLDITIGELEEYRKTHLVCDMCGQPETVRSYRTDNSEDKPNALSIDHDHSTGKFRGLLCYRCNRHLGWYDNNKEMVDEYLTRWQKG